MTTGELMKFLDWIYLTNLLSDEWREMMIKHIDELLQKMEETNG